MKLTPRQGPGIASRASAPSVLLRLPFFYGWLVVGVAMVSSFLGAGVNNVAMGAIFKPLSDDMGWSRTLTAGAIAAGTICGGLVAPIIGRWADRMGPRLLVPLGGAVVGSLALAISLVSKPWQFYAAYVPARALAQTLLFGVVPLTAVTNWFYLKRPRVMGLVAMCVPVGAAALALLYQALVSLSGWRSAFVALGALLWICVVVPGALLLRRQPEDLGLTPDGVPPDTGQRPRTDEHPGPSGAGGEYSWTWEEAVRTPAFWLIAVSATMAVVSTGGIAFHQVAYFTDVGIEPFAAAGALSVFALCGGVASGMWGFLAERMAPRRLAMAAFLLAAAGVVLLQQVRTPFLAYVFAVVFGLAARGEDALVQVILAHYFGRRSYGAISGLTEPFWRTGLGTGPLVAAAAFDLMGSYQMVFTLFTAFFLMAALLMFLARRPVPPPKAVDAGPLAI